MEQTSGTVVALYEYGETSLIVHWCTQHFGLIHTMARGARAAKSPFRGKLDLFQAAELHFVRNRRSDLHSLREVSLKKARFGLRDSYIQTLAASYFTSLINLVAERETPIEAFYELLERGLDYLAERQPDQRAVNFFEKELTEALGLGRGGGRALYDYCGRLPGMRSELLDRLSK